MAAKIEPAIFPVLNEDEKKGLATLADLLPDDLVLSVSRETGPFAEKVYALRVTVKLTAHIPLPANAVHQLAGPLVSGAVAREILKNLDEAAQKALH